MRNTVNVSYSLSKELDEAVKKFADLTNRKQSGVVEMALEDFMARPDVQDVLRAEPMTLVTAQESRS